ncbi:Gfo/Idh/MocA family protein [Streptomyces sp. NBC_00059]|uniref:Gfo/Idh/MocA family protein n=1 Tax=Streptomyces sp. NBC_00059 TaxID=2975635 RepID=UPI0022570B9A|nr:Gfo/Idh/MocA family oxidoreductase [Streptomyces sp. NBC_00059]MCX5415948.1 Gfo/Idh/MocA family oxidoreductase [Streptomyces sp. NBC_00059]
MPSSSRQGPRPRAAVVGTGGIVTGNHLSALASLRDRIDLVAAVDVDRGRLDAFRRRAAEAGFADVSAYSDLTAMLEEARPDLVLIGTPPVFHCEQTVAALKAGAWVLCEKPLTLSLAEYDEIAAAEEASGAYASVVFQHRYGSGAVHARSLLAEGTLGRPLVAHCQTTWYRDAAYYEVPWRGRWASEGGGPVMGHGIHQFDLMLHLLGEWTEVKAMASRLVHDTESEDVSTALVRFKDGALGTVVNSVLSPDETSRIRIDCEKATVELTHLYGHSNGDWRYTAAPGAEPPPAPAADVPSSHAAQLTALLDAYEAGTRPSGSGQSARSTLEFAAAMYKAAFTGATVKVGEIGPGDPFYAAMHGDHPDWSPKQ